MSNPLLTTRSVSKKYGTHNALDDVSFEMQKGEIISLLGPNGAGKTTLSSIIATLCPPTSGDVLFRGQSIYSDIPGYRRHIGYCHQRSNLHPSLTLYDNLVFAGHYFGMSHTAITARIEELTDRLQLRNYLHAFPDMLSGGYKQRFMIARSLMHRPELVILDEPTVALDPHIRLQLWEYIKLLKQDGVSILLTTHYLDEAEFLSDRVVLLSKGRIRLIDTPQHLMAEFKKERLEDVFVHLMQEEV